ncbi:YtpI family protein [Lentibacillus halophilus]|uniref:YtpI family protein n=1 Tax=Lentibacillus halophilus TaxID=295065 RepID=A0ABP3IVR9_9BACI
MVIFPIIIVLSAVFWIYYKVAILKSGDGLTKEYFNAKSRVCLGSLIFFFGINQYMFYETRLSLFIGIVFLFFGGLHLYVGMKEARHYRNEWRRLRA